MKEFLEKEPNSIIGHIWSGYFNFRYFKDKEQALTNFNFVIENVNPKGQYEIYYIDALHYLGIIYQENGNVEKAKEFYEKLLAHDRTKRYHKKAKFSLEKLKEN